MLSKLAPCIILTISLAACSQALPEPGGLAACPLTQPPATHFVPPEPYPPQVPYEGFFWYGSADLWTMLPTAGVWENLAFHTDADGQHYFQKVLWWRQGYDYRTEPQPVLSVSAVNLSNANDAIQTADTTNMYHPDIESAMLTGLEFPSPGCWQITALNHSQQLRFVVWIAP